MNSIQYKDDGFLGTMDLPNGTKLVSVVIDENAAKLQLLGADGHPEVDLLVTRTAADADIKAAVDRMGRVLAAAA